MLGYPMRLIVIWAGALGLGLIWLVLPLDRSLIWLFSAVIGFAMLTLLGWRTCDERRTRHRYREILDALGVATADIPLRMRTRMPLVMVVGDGLSQLFDRNGESRHVHVSEGNIWLRVDAVQTLPSLTVAVRQWRDGRCPEAIMLCVAPGLHASADLLAQRLSGIRQALADATRALGVHLPGYLAVYQRLTPATVASTRTPTWHGVSCSHVLSDGLPAAAILTAAENEAERHDTAETMGVHVAALASVIGWTQRVILDALADRRQPVMQWPLCGAGWIDCGPRSDANSPWENEVRLQTTITRKDSCSSAVPWPLPRPVIEAMPVRYWISPRRLAIFHALALLACAAGIAFWGAAKNNAVLMKQAGEHLERYRMIPPEHDTMRQEALQALIIERDLLDRHERAGIPLRLSFGMYRGKQLLPLLNEAIASYEPPAPPPTIITLDSMSLFESGKAELKAGSNRALVDALDMIKAHPDKRILVAGHTDSTGSADSNLKLSTARAQAVSRWLADASGIALTRFAVQGYGMTRPLADNTTAEGRARNRRVEITLIPDTGS